MDVVEVREGEQILARYIPAEKVWSGGLNFFSLDDEFVQVGSWRYPTGKQLLAHAHNRVPREVLWTQEVLFVYRGKLRARIYDSQKVQVAEIIVAEGDAIMLLAGGHGYEILMDDTRVLEVKNGPYPGAAADRVRFPT